MVSRHISGVDILQVDDLNGDILEQQFTQLGVLKIGIEQAGVVDIGCVALACPSDRFAYRPNLDFELSKFCIRGIAAGNN